MMYLFNMHTIKVAAASLNQTPLAWEHNRQNILDVIQEARKQVVQILCCPELCITGYGCEDMFLAVATQERALKMAFDLAPETRDMMVVLGLPLLYREGLYNTACVLIDGKIRGFVAKQHLANAGVYYERRWFKPWNRGEVANFTYENQHFPLGDLIFEVNGFRMGFEICEDAWVAERTGTQLAARGVDILLNPSASHFAFGKAKIRKQLIREGARAFGVGYVYANLLGNEAGRLIYDGDTIIAAGSKMLAEGPRFSFQDWVLSSALIDVMALRMERAQTADLNPNTEEDPGVIYGSLRQITTQESRASSPLSQNPRSFENTDHLREEEFTRAVCLGLFDYLRKSRARGFVLNLSGGADSSTCAVLVYFMVKLAIEEMGFEVFKRKLAYMLNPTGSVAEVLHCLLFCLYQQTDNNSEETKKAAEDLSKTLGFPLANLDINDLVQAYQHLIEPVVSRPLTWSQDNITLQNVQARVRGPSIWLLANLRQAILLCTSNRSEAAVGYTTIDGDTCGGLSPLAGISKSFIIHWLKWVERVGPLGVGPLKVLKAVTALQPSAELCPLEMSQTDEADLMPYQYLDNIERLFVLEKKSPLEILLVLQTLYPKESPRTLGHYIERFFSLWAQNQWKRERIAPSFHLDEESVDPKNFCRFPILSGAFRAELAEMWGYLK